MRGRRLCPTGRGLGPTGSLSLPGRRLPSRLSLPSGRTGLSCIPAGLSCIPAGLSCIPAGLSCIPAGLSCIPAGLSCIPAGRSCIPAGLSRFRHHPGSVIAQPVGGSNLDVLARPAARPRAAAVSASLRDASSIISPSSVAAPRPRSV
jgi:hypothetical protein